MKNLQTQIKHTHAFHPYPAKFPGDIIRNYIQEYSEQGDNVIDPFCGSGTTLVECLLLNRNCLGIDLNPVAVLISKSKSAKYLKKDEKILDLIIQELEASLINPTKWIKENFFDTLPKYENRDYWFKDFVMTELNTIKSSIIDKSRNNTRLHELLLTAFSKIIVQVSNQDGETRYAKIEKNIVQGDTSRLFLKTLKSYQKIIINPHSIPNKSRINVIHGNALDELPKLKENAYDMAITSPPYINSFDYYLYHKHRIFLLDEDPLLVRKNEIGGHHVIDTQSYEKALSNYQNAIQKTFNNLNRLLKPDKKFVLFIGDGIVKGQLIDISYMISKIAKDTGFNLVKKNSIPLEQVSRGFIKNEKIKKKQHHVMIFNNNK